LSAYNFFFQEQRQRLIKERMEGNYTQQSSFASLARTVATRWRTLEPELLQVYQEMAQRDRDRYQSELAIWTKKRADATKLEEQRLAEQAKFDGHEPGEVEEDTTAKVDTADEKLCLSSEGGTGRIRDSDGRLPNGGATRNRTDEMTHLQHQLVWDRTKVEMKPTMTSSLSMGPPMKRHFKEGHETSDEDYAAGSPVVGDLQSTVSKTASGMVHRAAHSQTPIVTASGVPNKLPIQNYLKQSRDSTLPPHGYAGAFASSDARASVSTDSMSLPETTSAANSRTDGRDPPAHATGFDLIIAAAFGNRADRDMVVYKRAEE
jgi:HMG (high mobility group) box